MTTDRLEVLYEKTQDGYTIKSPAVGIFKNFPESGSILRPASCIGQLQIIKKIFCLYLPQKIGGTIKVTDESKAEFPVSYQQPLCDISLSAEVSIANTEQSDTSAATGLVVYAPTDGMFYRKSSPEAPAFVELGATIKKGQVLGLIEIMKTFNQVFYEGKNLPEHAKVVEICAEDSTEVTTNTPLFVVEKLN